MALASSVNALPLTEKGRAESPESVTAGASIPPIALLVEASLPSVVFSARESVAAVELVAA